MMIIVTKEDFKLPDTPKQRVSIEQRRVYPVGMGVRADGGGPHAAQRGDARLPLQKARKRETARARKRESGRDV